MYINRCWVSQGIYVSYHTNYAILCVLPTSLTKLIVPLQGIQQIKDRIQPGPPGLEFAGRNLAPPVPDRRSQVPGSLHLQHLLGVLLGLLDIAASTGVGEAVHGLRVFGIALVGAAQIVEGL